MFFSALWHCWPLFIPHCPLTSSSNPCLLLDPLSELGDTGVDTGLVPTSTALSPAHNASLEPLPTLLKAHQGATRISLVNMVREEWLLDWVWKWEHDNCRVWKPIYKSFLPFILLLRICCVCSPGMRQLLLPRNHCRASWRWSGPPWPCYTLYHWWF